MVNLNILGNYLLVTIFLDMNDKLYRRLEKRLFMVA